MGRFELLDSLWDGVNCKGDTDQHGHVAVWVAEP